MSWSRKKYCLKKVAGGYIYKVGEGYYEVYDDNGKRLDAMDDPEEAEGFCEHFGLNPTYITKEELDELLAGRTVNTDQKKINDLRKKKSKGRH